MDVNLQENKTFRSLMSGNVLNARTTLPFMTEVVKETFAPNGIAISHWRRREGMWPALAKKTKSKKGHSVPWLMSGRALAAISKPIGGKVLHWGSSADIHSGTMRWRDRYSSHGVYASTRGNRKEA